MRDWLILPRSLAASEGKISHHPSLGFCQPDDSKQTFNPDFQPSDHFKRIHLQNSKISYSPPDPWKTHISTSPVSILSTHLTKIAKLSINSSAVPHYKLRRHRDAATPLAETVHPSAARSPVKQRCISANAPKKARFACGEILPVSRNPWEI